MSPAFKNFLGGFVSGVLIGVSSYLITTPFFQDIPALIAWPVACVMGYLAYEAFLWPDRE